MIDFPRIFLCASLSAATLFLAGCPSDVPTQPEARLEVQPEAKPEAQPEAKLEVQPEVKPEAQPEAKPEAPPEAKLEAQNVQQEAPTAPDGNLISGFEQEGEWTTAPLAALKAAAAKGAAHLTPPSYVDPMVKPRTPEELASGAKLVPEHVTQGKSALRWDNHPVWPTLHTTQVPADWSGAAAVSLDVHSEKATGEIVTLAFEVDSPATPFRDLWYLPIRINWTGNKTIILPVSEFQRQGQPEGWKNISGFGFFTKMLGAQPHPATALTIDNLQMLEAAPSVDTWREVLAELPRERDADGFLYKVTNKDWQRDQFNHEGPEMAGDEPVLAPYAHQNVFRNERAEFGYLPKFVPGYVSFDPQGKAYIFSGDWIQWKGTDGRWEHSDLRPVLTDWAKSKRWKGLQFAWNLNEGEKTVRFDKEGDAYALATINRIDSEGVRIPGASYTTLLLRSRDGLRSWEVHSLGPVTATFEKMDGHNLECLDRPPVMILGDRKHLPGANEGGYLLLPAKEADGSLILPAPVKFSDFAIGVPVHSGDGNMAITSGGKVFVVYSWYKKALEQKKLAEVNGSESSKTAPPIPKGHPGLAQSFQKPDGKTVASGTSGTPIYIVSYDLATGALSEPVYLMSGGVTMDDHNWPAITVDSKGILHVLANGHQSPLNYIRSLAPHDISAWTAPQFVADGSVGETQLSYATFNCDREDNLYSVNRNTSGRYNNRLTLFSKPSNSEAWTPQTLVAPYSAGYKNWGHKMAYNPAADQLCLSFYSQSNLKQLWKEAYPFDLFIWPDREPSYYGGLKNPDTLRLNTGSPEEQLDRNFSYSMAWASEPVSLITTPDGKWKLATTPDFQ